MKLSRSIHDDKRFIACRSSLLQTVPEQAECELTDRHVYYRKEYRMTMAVCIHSSHTKKTPMPSARSGFVQKAWILKQ